MSRQIECPRCGIRVQSKFTTDQEKIPLHVAELMFCPVCGIRLKVVRNELGQVVGAVRVGSVCKVCGR